MVEQAANAGNPNNFPRRCWHLTGGASSSPYRGIGGPFPARNVAYELGREREKGHEMTWKIDEKESGTTGCSDCGRRLLSWPEWSHLGKSCGSLWRIVPCRCVPMPLALSGVMHSFRGYWLDCVCRHWMKCSDGWMLSN